jgi:predicted metal-dependent hydrolase
MHQIEVNGLVVDIDRKDIKNLHLAVYPPDGRVRVATPLRVDDEAVRFAVILKWSWIKRQQFQFEKQDRQSPREYVSGESHYFQGHRYLLTVILDNTSPKIVLRNNTTIELHVRSTATMKQREKIFREWYREHLKAEIPPLVDKWQDVIGVELDDWGVKLMKTKWGSCNIEARRIWLNLELAKKPLRCLEYIIVHELVHLLERNHNDRFRAYMNKFLPSWRTIRDELNRSPLGHQNWEY